MARRADRLYAGAAGCISLAEIKALGAAYSVQPKHDGCYSLITFDRTGSIGSIIMRSGDLAPASIRQDFAGVRWAPDSVLVCELEAWTEAANRLAAGRGYRIATILDAQRVSGRDVTRAPYRERRDAVFRAESLLVQDDDDRPWVPDASGRAHDPTTGSFVRPVPRSWRRLPIVEQRPARAAEALWDDFVGRDGGEGICAINLDAPIGKRGSKLKCRASSVLDATVVRLSPSHAELRWAGGTFIVSRLSKIGADLSVGALVECKHDGFTERRGEPRHARLVRVRRDLMRAEVVA